MHTLLPHYQFNHGVGSGGLLVGCNGQWSRHANERSIHSLAVTATLAISHSHRSRLPAEAEDLDAYSMFHHHQIWFQGS